MLGCSNVFTRCATLPPTATRLYSKAQGQPVVSGRHPGLWAQRRICTLKECDNCALLPKGKGSMFTICAGASPRELELVDAATVVAPRQGAWTIGIAYPGCATARRPWAVEYNAFSVEIPGCHGPSLHSEQRRPGRPEKRIAIYSACSRGRCVGCPVTLPREQAG